MATQNPPQDVPWSKVASSAALHNVRDSTDGQHVRIESALAGLAPSISIFQYVSPKLSEELPDSTPYPESRIVLLRIPSSLTGVNVFTSMTISSGLRRHHVESREYLPCIGAVVNVSLSSPDLDSESKRFLYIRDIFPKHQEMIQNEILGTETMEREVQSILGPIVKTTNR